MPLSWIGCINSFFLQNIRILIHNRRVEFRNISKREYITIRMGGFGRKGCRRYLLSEYDFIIMIGLGPVNILLYDCGWREKRAV